MVSALFLSRWARALFAVHHLAGIRVEGDCRIAGVLPRHDAALQVRSDRHAGLNAFRHGHRGAFAGTTMKHDRTIADRQRAWVETGKRKQQRTVDAFGDVFLWLAHIDQHDAALAQCFVYLGRCHLMKTWLSGHRMLLCDELHLLDLAPALLTE